MDICHLKKRGVRTRITEVLRQSRAPWWRCKRRLWSPCSFYWTGLVCVPNWLLQNHGRCLQDYQIATDTTADAVSAYTQVKLEDARRSLRIPKTVQTYGYVFHDTNGRNHGQTLMIQWYFSNEICMDTHSQDCCGKHSAKKFCRNLDWKNVPNSECLFVHRRQGLFLSVYVDDIKMTGKKQNMAPMWKKLMKLVDLGTYIWDALNVTAKRTKPLLTNTECWSSRTHIISGSRVFGMYSTWMQTEWNSYWGIYKDVRITYFCWSYWKVTKAGKNLTQRRLCGPMTCKDMSKMRRETLRAGKQKSGATIQSFKSLFGWSWKEYLNQLENCQTHAHKLSEMLVRGTNC